MTIVALRKVYCYGISCVTFALSIVFARLLKISKHEIFTLLRLLLYNAICVALYVDSLYIYALYLYLCA